MESPFFIYNNKSSLDYGIIANKLPSILRASERVEKIKIDGRHGVLHQSDGTYEEILKSVECSLIDILEVDSICSWLKGKGEIIFSNEPDKFYKGYIINQIEFKKIFNTLKSFIVQFECEPFRYLLEGKDTVILTQGTKLYNQGTFESEPILTIEGSGDIDLIINNEIVKLKQLSTPITIDSQMKNAYYGSINLNNKMYGEFPTFSEGENSISWTGNVTKISITPNWRCL